MKKGFTLIEVISVIVILGIIGLIAVPIANNITKSSKDKLYKEQVNRIIDSCKKYAVEEDSILPEEKEGSMRIIDVADLKDSGAISGDLKNPYDKEEMDGVITITYHNNEYEYEYEDVVYYAVFDNKMRKTPIETTKTRPTNNGIYLRYSVKNRKASEPRACLYTKGRELCIKYGDYETNLSELLTFFDYDEQTWTTSQRQYPTEIATVRTNSDVECVFFKKHVFCLFLESGIGMDVDTYNQATSAKDSYACNTFLGISSGCGIKNVDYQIVD